MGAVPPVARRITRTPSATTTKTTTATARRLLLRNEADFAAAGRTASNSGATSGGAAPGRTVRPCASVWSRPDAGTATVESPGWSGHCCGMRSYPAAIRSSVTGGRSKRVSAVPGGCAAAGGTRAGGTGGTAGRSKRVSAERGGCAAAGGTRAGGTGGTAGRSKRVALGSASTAGSSATAGRSNAVGASGPAPAGYPFACRPTEPLARSLS